MLEEHIKFIKEAAILKGIEDFHLEIDSQSDGGNYFGIITKVIVKQINGNEKLNLVLKKAPLSEEARQKRAILPAFEREYELYNNIFPKFDTFQQNISSKFQALPKYYNGTLEHKKEAILMEDLTASGYKLWKRLEPMDFNHMALIFQEYAKLHAVSLALRHKHTKTVEDLTKNIKLNFLKQREAKMPAHYKRMREIVLEKGAQAVLGDKVAERAYKKFQESFWQFLSNDQKYPEKDLLVISHGDCHPDNILFKYDEISNKPKKLCLIDWQMSCTESPINDISFVLFTCADKEVLNRYKDLFKIYHGTITENLNQFGCNPLEVFSYDTFINHWKKHFLHGLYRSQVCLKLFLRTPKEIAELGESTSILDVLKKDFSVDSLFAQRMKILFQIVGEKWLRDE